MTKTEFTKPNLLLVEGKTDELFFSALNKHLGFHDIQIIDVGGTSKFQKRLEAISVSPKFHIIKSLGIVSDNDSKHPSKTSFECITDYLRYVNLPTPESPLLPKGNNPQVTVMILPSEGKTGMLEDLCLKSIESDPAMPCVNQYCQCLQEKCPSFPKNISKAKVQVFLASRKEAEKGLGIAARDGYWPFENAAFNEVKQFIRSILSND